MSVKSVHLLGCLHNGGVLVPLILISLTLTVKGMSEKETKVDEVGSLPVLALALET